MNLGIWQGAWLTWAVGQAKAGRRRPARTDDGRRPAAGGVGGAGGGEQAKIAMSRQRRGLRGRADGRAKIGRLV